MANDYSHLPVLPDTLKPEHLDKVFRWETPDWPQVITVSMWRASPAVSAFPYPQVSFERGYDQPTKAAWGFHQTMEDVLRKLEAEDPEGYAEYRRFHGNTVAYRPTSLDWPQEMRKKFIAVAEACTHMLFPEGEIYKEWEHGSGSGGWTAVIKTEGWDE